MKNKKDLRANLSKSEVGLSYLTYISQTDKLMADEEPAVEIEADFNPSNAGLYDSNEFLIIYFDLETTRKEVPLAKIIQIGLLVDEQMNLCRYVDPESGKTPERVPSVLSPFPPSLSLSLSLSIQAHTNPALSIYRPCKCELN